LKPTVDKKGGKDAKKGENGLTLTPEINFGTSPKDLHLCADQANLKKEKKEKDAEGNFEKRKGPGHQKGETPMFSGERNVATSHIRKKNPQGREKTKSR